MDDEVLEPTADIGETADEPKVKRRKLTEKQRRQKEIADFKLLLEQPIGRDFVWRVLSECKIYHNPNYGEQGQRDLGRRDVGLWLLKEILENEPEAYIIMQREDRERSEGKLQ